MDKDFIAVVQVLHTQACILCGKVQNPASGAFEKNIEQARMFIDMLAMLERKTAGNVTEDESRFLQQALKEVRLHYVEAQ